MKKILSVMLLLFAVAANAQLTKIFETPVVSSSSRVINNVNAFDAENLNDIYFGYYAFLSGSEAKILNLKTQEIEHTLNITAFVDTTKITSLGVSCYKNFFKSDGAWSCLIKPYSSYSETMKIIHNGKVISTTVQNSLFAEVRQSNGNLYVVSKLQDKIEVYLVRNDLPQTTAIPYNSSYISALKRISDEHEAKLFNVVGQKIDDAYYGTLPDYLKKTIYAK
ncbi:hypothetical protein B7988_02955 [Fibrobacter sp. UWB1]|uniref:hypothetical protein n=1 Tax=Fibrobacter sp. UWB1 TaxID=1964355 RepID=UPI000B5267FA|nr:hypothetical protein [Fibrobacter sp. UWB1]OWV27127.1 hypothetical protein B7988_02955 [Fibrobacter sp. UWB1]